MHKLVIISFLFLSQLFGNAQSRYTKRAIDTLVVGNDSVIIFADKSWEYIKMINFDGITNKDLHEIAKKHGWKEDWNNNVPYTYDNDLSQIKDTIWICVADGDSTSFCMPSPGLVTSTYKYRGKRFHYGIDVDLETGDTLFATFDGIVRYAKYNSSGFGNLIIIRHNNGLETYYAHLSKLLVSPNQDVKAGDVIGLGGNTGKSTGSHLHFEVRLFGNALNPEEIIDFKNNKLKTENLLLNGAMFSKNKSSKSKSSAGKSSSSKSVHTVKSGDSLYYIALKYKTTVSKLCKLNGIKSTDIIHVGDKIKLK